MSQSKLSLQYPLFIPSDMRIMTQPKSLIDVDVTTNYDHDASPPLEKSYVSHWRQRGLRNVRPPLRVRSPGCSKRRGPHEVCHLQLTSHRVCAHMSINTLHRATTKETECGEELGGLFLQTMLHGCSMKEAV
ncbi:unnamed protein product [Soboliphyme baturini]|uniref:Uncharacterized protein n=1 Tax=Soboliphyme baturini TaxID=241478 RepID=A0A183IWV0_9BILA|nr:unnamed protein product [Soboliphyme baturini]